MSFVEKWIFIFGFFRNAVKLLEMALVFVTGFTDDSNYGIFLS